MKRTICVFIISILCIFALCGCESKEEKEAKQAQEHAERVNDAYRDSLQKYNDINNYYQNNR